MATTSEASGPSMRRRCEMLSISRSGLYYEPAQPDAEELAVMRRIDEIHLEHPFYGSLKWPPLFGPASASVKVESAG